MFRREPAELKSELYDRLQLSDVSISRLSLEEMFVAFVGSSEYGLPAVPAPYAQNPAPMLFCINRFRSIVLFLIGAKSG